MKPLADVIDAHARRIPEAPAFLCGGERVSWRQYAERSDALARTLHALGLDRGDRVAVQLPDGASVHVAYVAAEKAGLVVVGLGPRAGLAEVRHLVGRTGARALLSRAAHRGEDMGAFAAELGLERHVVAGSLADDDPLLAHAPDTAPDPSRRLGSDELFFLNSTSGTTGMPKCVSHDQARWNHFHTLAVEAGEMTPEDVFMSVLPAPFGFGLWTQHFTPALLGAPTVLMERFDADGMVRAIAQHGVSVLAAVSTQFIMLLGSPELARRDLSCLRALFTGGEAVPYERAAEFEERSGALVLQFYGSNETGALSRTTTKDSRDVRLRSAGHVIESMQVRLFDDAGHDVTASGRGQPGCRGALTSRGYWDDDAANAELYTEDGWMLTGDIATLDADGVLRVVGRSADFIIRGGKNVSGPAVEAAVSTHPAVALAAAVAMPDPVFGERVCVYAELRPGETLTLPALIEHLSARGESKETFPERLEVVDALPRASGGKIAKAALREDIARRVAEERA